MIPVKDFPDYLVSRNGEVFSISRNKLMKINIKKTGYAHLNLWKDGKRKTISVHRIVASTYLENPNNYGQVNHKDGNKLNNTVDNLEWCSASFNVRHAHETGLVSYDGRGSLDDFQILTIRTMTNVTHDDMGKFYGISGSMVHNIRHNKSYIKSSTTFDIIPKYYKTNIAGCLNNLQKYEIAISDENINILAAKYGVTKFRICEIRKKYRDGYKFEWGSK